MDMQWDPPSDTVSVTCDGMTDEFFLFAIDRLKIHARKLLDSASEMERIFKKRSAEQDYYLSYLRGRIHELESTLVKMKQEAPNADGTT
jgi:hypothetical protein